MIAIMIKMRTLYDCNLNSESDHIWLQSLPGKVYQLGPNMNAMSKIVLGSRDYDFWTNLVKINFRLLQSYLVFFEDCNHIWSDSELTLQSYLVPMIPNIIANISGPPLYRIWNSRIQLISISPNFNVQYAEYYWWFQYILLPHFFRSVLHNIRYILIRYENGMKLMLCIILWRLFYAFWSEIMIYDMFLNINLARCILFHFVVYLHFHMAKNLFSIVNRAWSNTHSFARWQH